MTDAVRTENATKTRLSIAQVKKVLRYVRLTESGKAVSESDRAYKRGWRDALRYAAAELDRIGSDLTT